MKQTHVVIYNSSSANDIEDAKSLYKKVAYGGEVKSDDHIFLARIDNQLVGVVRLCPEMGVLVLRGMQVLPSFQQQGIGSQLLQRCSHHLSRQSCYCLPWSHLRDFYGRIGFQEISSMKAPCFLRERLQNYVDREMDVILMHKPAITP
jgi:predicted N-acetyltransferase YhbS